MKAQLPILFVAISICIFLGCKDNLKKEEQVTQPNLLVIMTDEHNFRTLGCYRETLTQEEAYIWGEGLVVETPNIDFLAQNGVLFSKFYAVAPLCSPSRSSFVSGLYPHHTGVEQNDSPMHDTIVTFAEVLRKKGYATGYAGKWHLDGTGKPQWEPERDFGFSDNRFMFNRGHWKKVMDTPEGPLIDAVDSLDGFTYDLNDANDKSYMTDYLTDKTLDFIKKNKEKPFCYMLSYPDPHGPDTVRSPYDTMYTDMQFTPPATYYKEDKDLPSWASKTEKEIDQSQYFGMVKCIDDNIGRLIEYLKVNNLLDNTIIVFTSDHGDLRGEHQRRNKGVPLEASAKVPFIVYAESLKQKRGKVENAFNSVDFAPSILGLMGYNSEHKMEGIDFSELIKEPKSKSQWRNFTVMRSSGNAKTKWIAAVTSRYKLVLSESDLPWLLDLEQNPQETINYINVPENRNVVRELAQDLKDYADQHKDPFLQNTVLAEFIPKLINP